jgi:hypothetical protein
MQEMETAIAGLIVAGVTLLFNVALHIFGGGWRLSHRLSSMEITLTAVQEDIRKLGDVLIKMADMRGELRVLDTRVTAAEQDIRELRHGEGFVRGSRGIDKEYP